MSNVPITVLICVGPEPRHSAFLIDALKSVAAQTVVPDEVLVIDDMAGLRYADVVFLLEKVPNVRVWEAPWNLGNVGAVNCGVSLAKNECVILLASDDMLHPMCVERCQATYSPTRWPLAYYWFDVQLMGKEDYIQRVVSGPSMVTKSLWKATGGVPIEGCVGDAESFFVNILGTHFAGSVEFVNVKLPDPDPAGLYTARLIDDNDRYIRLAGGWDTVIDAVKNLATQNWKAPSWGRYEL